MKHYGFLIPLTCLVACGGQAPDSMNESTSEIVNGAVNTTAEFQAVVSLAFGTAVEDPPLCSGTFIHPNFVLTAAHCFPSCAGTITTGCTMGDKLSGVIQGIDSWTGVDGPDAKAVTICDGFGACTEPGEGTRHPVDLVFFPKSEHFVYANREPLDLAIVHTPVPFTGRPIPVMDGGGNSRSEPRRRWY